MDNIVASEKNFEQLTDDQKYVWNLFKIYNNNCLFVYIREKFSKVNARFAEKFQEKPDFYARAPGRVNLIGMSDDDTLKIFYFIK